MTTIALSRPAALAGRLAGLRRDLAAWLSYRRTRAELEALPDRMLADMGISRSGIDAVAREAVYGA